MYAGVLPVEVDCSEGEAVGANTLTSKFSPSFWKGLAGGRGRKSYKREEKKKSNDVPVYLFPTLMKTVV